MTWDPTRPKHTDWQGGPVTPVDVFYELDGPVIFTAKVGLATMLFFKHDETDDAEIFIVAGIDEAELTALRKGRVSVRGALSYRNAWLVKTDHEFVVKVYQSHDYSSILPYLPPKGVGLSANFGLVPDSMEQAESLLAFKFVGKSMTEESMPLSVFKELVDNVSSLVRHTLLPKALQKGRNNRFFDVQIGPPKFASLLVSIKELDFDSEGLREFKNTKNLIPQALREESAQLGEDLWKSIVETSELADRGDLELEQARVHKDILDHIANLVPSSDNDLDSLEVSYHGNDGTKVITIDEVSGDRIIQAGQLEGMEQKLLTGVVVEVNGDARTFIIKDTLDRQTTVNPKWRVFQELEKNDALRRGVVMKIKGLHWKRTRRDYMMTDEYPEIIDPKAGRLV
jgi:hypothetical protein